MKKMMSARFLLFVLLNMCLVNAEPLAQPPAPKSSSHEKLETCISEYRNGNYKTAADHLKTLLPSLSGMEDQVEAYRYLGFSYAMLNWIDKSKEVFKTGLGIYPAMAIDTLEVPPNIAIIFKQAKLEKKLEKIEASAAKTPKIIVKRKNVLAPALLLTLGMASAGASIDLFYYGNQQHQKYRSISTHDQHQLDMYFNNYRNAYIAGSACAALTAVLVPVSIHLFMKREIQMTVSFVNGTPSLVCMF
jgi:tetratricopeptide (TPR) repeat protein